MHPWHNYLTPDDFLDDPRFRQWVRSGAFRATTDPLTQWLAENPVPQLVAQKAADLLLATYLPDEHDPAADERVADTLRERTWAKIREQEGEAIETPVRPLWPRWQQMGTWVAAASVLLLVGWGVWRLQTPVSQAAEQVASATPSEVVNWHTQTNVGREPLLVGLVDGSSVWLHSGAKLRYPDRFSATTREVFLTGDAFFEVARNPQQPFLVQTDQLTTRVLGTSFLVRASAGNASVQVRSGRVEVSLRNPAGTSAVARRVVLMPAQQVVVTAEAPALSVSPVRQPDALAARLNQQSFEFTDASLPDILDAIAAAYGLRIDYDRQRFANCVLTTSLTDEPLPEKLNILAATLSPNTHFALNGNRVTLSGEGCP